MKWQGQDLVRVQSHAELKAGMMVVILGCSRCGAGRHSRFLVSAHEPTRVPHLRGPCVSPKSWKVTPTCIPPDKICFCFAIEEGRIYRLQEPPAEVNDYDEVKAPTQAKERVR